MIVYLKNRRNIPARAEISRPSCPLRSEPPALVQLVQLA
jgi:hypothetical protein